MPQRRGWGGGAILWGLLFGALASGLLVLDRFIVAPRYVANRATHPLLIGGFWMRIGLLTAGTLLLFLAGLVAARVARRVAAGIVAGLLAGAVVGVARLIMTPPAMGVVARRLAERSGSLARVVEMGGAAHVVGMLALAALVGAGLGALGGLAGRSGRGVAVDRPARLCAPPPPQANALPAPRFTPAEDTAPGTE